jgi:hypothetical protein
VAAGQGHECFRRERLLQRWVPWNGKGRGSWGGRGGGGCEGLRRKTLLTKGTQRAKARNSCVLVLSVVTSNVT